MRLYPLTDDVPAVDATEGHFEPQDDGGFDFPGPLADRMHAAHVAGRKQWETAIERQHRLMAAEAARRADPATLLAAVEKLVAQAEAGAAPPVEAAKPPRARSKSPART